MESDNANYPRYFIHLAYDGTNYSGWQVQANAPSVQQTINEALKKLLRQPIATIGCGRTDSGVHAKDFYLHLMTENEIADIRDFHFRLNCVLPDDISIFRIFRVPDRSHARFNATERSYEYYLHFDKSPFIKKYSFFQGFYPIDWEKVLQASAILKTTEDFTSLCLKSEDFKTNICKITEAKWEVLPSHHYILQPFDEPTICTPLETGYERKKGEVVRFTISSNRFLRGMVRKIVGTVLMVGKGKMSVAEFTETVAAKKEFRFHYIAPPNGLFLSKVRYPFIEG